VVADRRGLRLVTGPAAELDTTGYVDPWEFQARCLERFGATQRARGFSPITIEGDAAQLERFLALAAKPAWELTADDIDTVMATLADRGTGAGTRRDYASTFRQFFAYLQARHATEIAERFGVRLANPLDHLHAGRHVSDDSPDVRPPPTPERMDAFFGFLRERLDTTRRWASAARDYALFRTLYHAGLRSAEAAALEVRDLHFERGPFGKIHVRLGKAANGSGARPRWVPMLDDLELILRWFLDDARPRFRGDGVIVFCDQGGGQLNSGSIRNRLAALLDAEGRPDHERFTPHGLRHACATRNYERGVDLVAIQQMLGHWHVGTTMRYVTPSSTFVEDAYRRAITGTLAGLTDIDDKEG
jgi:integrase/recombinase XerD